jgi:MYXO-CTERM domain-containing protein
VYWDAGKVAPERVEVIVDGKAWPLERVRGVAAAGAYEGDVKVDGAGCRRYWFRAVAEGKASLFPDGGTLGLATTGTTECAGYESGGVTTDPGATGPEMGGCSVGHGGGVWWGLMVVGLLLRRRRRV